MRRIISPIIIALAVGLTLTACGTTTTNVTKVATGQNDINPVDVSKLKQGGTVNWPIEDYPNNFNMLQADATNGDIPAVVASFMPTPIVSDAQGNYTGDADYVTEVKQTSTDPQQVTYTLNPKAKWSDGTAITWEDYKSQWQASNGKNTAYQVLSTAGYGNVSDIARGKDDYQFVVTFSPKFAEWNNLFTILYPKSTTSSPDVFNKGWLDKALVTAGPFKVGTYDKTNQVVTVVRDPSWWGTKAVLDSINFKSTADIGANKVDSVANGSLDFAGIAADLTAYKKAQQLSTIVFRRANLPNYRTIAFNNAAGHVTSDAQVRLAVIRAINRVAITSALASQLLQDPTPLGNHLIVRGFPGYQDNSVGYGYDPAAAAKLLDADGWTLNGQYRQKNGATLEIRDVVPTGTAASTDEAKLIQTQLGKVGIKLTIDTVPSSGFFSQHVNVGDFDITHYSRMGDSAPVVSNAIDGFFKSSADNYAKIDDPIIDNALTQAAQELDVAKRLALVNAADKELWKIGATLPLYQRPSIVAVRKGLANFGNSGLASLDYAEIGWTQ